MGCLGFVRCVFVVSILVAEFPKSVPCGEDEGGDCLGPVVAAKAFGGIVFGVQVGLLKEGPLKGESAKEQLIPTDFALFVEEAVVLRRDIGCVERALLEPSRKAVE